MKKLLATDLDGTLLKDDKTISNYTINKVHEMINEGHYFVVATGRPFFRITNILNQLDIVSDNVYCICNNGGLIISTDGSKVLYEENMPHEHVEELIDLAINYTNTTDNLVTNWYPIRIIDDAFIADTLNDFILKNRWRSPIASVYKNFISIINMIKQNQINPYYFSNCQDIYLIDINLLNDNINILNEYKLFGNMKAGEDYKFFNNVNLKESIEIIFNLGLGNYLKDLTILNYADKFNRLRILKMLNISIESREQLISILTTNKFFVPDEMIPKYVDIHNKSKSLK